MAITFSGVLPVGLRVKSGSWEVPAIFPHPELGMGEDMLRTFNMVGMILVVPPETCAPLLRQIEKKEPLSEIGLIEEEAGKVSVVIE